MPLRLSSGATVVFQGDSVTDCGRTGTGDGLGTGYAKLSTALLGRRYPSGGLTFVNRGISGNRVADLRTRWDADAMAHQPDLLSVLIGINDTWRRYETGEITTTEAYERDYRHLLTRVRDELGSQLLLAEPFLIPVNAEQHAWREDLDPRIDVVRRLAEEFHAALLPADALLNEAARQAGSPEAVADDGIHPTPLGHEVLARAWADLVTVR